MSWRFWKHNRRSRLTKEQRCAILLEAVCLLQGLWGASKAGSYDELRYQTSALGLAKILGEESR